MNALPSPGKQLGDATKNETQLGFMKRKLLVGLLDDTLPLWLSRRARAAMAKDPHWLAAYNALRRAQRANASKPALGRMQFAHLERLVLDDADDRSAFSSAPGRGRAFSSLAAAAASAAVFLFAFGAPQTPSDVSGAWQSRGGNGETRVVGVKVRCLTEKNGAPKVRSETVLGGGAVGRPLHCGADELLAFSMTNLSSTPAYAFVIGVRDDGEPLWFAPFSPASQSVSMVSGTADAVVSTVAELERMQLGHEVTLHALFSKQPLDGTDIQAALKRARQNGINLARLDRLPVTTAKQTRATLLPSTQPRANGGQQP